MSGFDDPDYQKLKEQILGKQNGNSSTSNGVPARQQPQISPEQALHDWRYHVGLLIKEALDAVPEKDRETVAGFKKPILVDTVVKDAKKMMAARERPVWPLPPDLSESEAEEELDKLANRAVEVFCGVYLPATQNGNGNLPALTDLPIEMFDEAIEANARYLEREPVIEGLCYSSATSMITGGKHSGKSTLARWEAMCVCKGYDFLGRKVQQGPVIYLASEDEEMVARSELIRLGWTKGDPLYFVGKTQIPDDLDEQAVLNLLADQIVKQKAVLCVVDMLFDFIPVRDELGYAETRRAVGLIQNVASKTGIHLTVLHHAPKHMSPTADAAVAALGSQGLAARVSPLLLVRRFGPGVHSMLTTSVRDPRGQAIPESRLFLDDSGALRLGGIFKAYMLAEVYMPRLLEILEDEPEAEFTINELSEALGPDTGYAVTRQCLASMYRNGLVERLGSGKKGKPYRYSMKLANGPTGDPELETGVGCVSNTGGRKSAPKRASQESFEYKKNFTPPGDDSDPEPEGYTLPDKYGISKGD